MRRLVCYDPRGRGRSSAVEPRALSAAADVADLEAVRTGLGLGRCAVLGHSYLATVALWHALDHPGAVERLVLVGGYPPRRMPPFEAAPPAEAWLRPPLPALEALRKAGLDQADPPAFARAWMREFLLPAQVARPEHVALVPLDALDLENEFPDRWVPAFLERVFPSLGDWDFRPRLPSLRAPVLLVEGEAERMPPEAERDWLEGLPDAGLLVVPGAGHYPFVENPSAFFAAVNGFLSGEWPPGAPRSRR